MRILFAFIVSFSLIACNRQTELQKHCAGIRKIPQAPFPSGTDPKWKLIKELEKIKDPALPDSVKSIFSSIDTSILGYGEYCLALLNLLAKPDSRSSLKLLAEIYRDNYISDPSCSQLLLSQVLMDKNLLGQMTISFFTKKNNVDYSQALKNVDVMFPDLAHILGKRPFSDDPIIELLQLGIKSGALDAAKLKSSKTELLRFYEEFHENLDQPHLSALIEVLAIFKGDDDVDKILARRVNKVVQPID